MVMDNELHLYEEIMLLALRDEDGTVASGAMYSYAVGGAILAELLLKQRLCIEEPRKRKKLVTLVMGDAHEQVKRLKEPIDILFLDADKQGYLDYLTKLLPLVEPGGLVIAHNVTARQADPRYVKAITSNPELETLFLNLESSGIGVTMKKR